MIKMTEIADQNPWWRLGINFLQHDQHLTKIQKLFIDRKIISLEKENIYIISGPRLVGKSTYLKAIVKELIQKNIHPQQIYYLSCDSFTSRREFRNALLYFIDSNRDKPILYILLDEATSIKGWNTELKDMLDKGMMKNCIPVITISNADNVANLTSLFPGDYRSNSYFIKPVCFREFVLHAAGQMAKTLSDEPLLSSLSSLEAAVKGGILELNLGIDELAEKASRLFNFRSELDLILRHYLTCGGFPLVMNNYLVNLEQRHQFNIDPVVAEIFIRRLLGGLSKAQKQETICRHLLKVMIERYGRRYSFSSLAREVEITHVTAIDYLRFIEDSFLGFIIYAYDFGKRAPKYKGDKKVYFLDPFLLTAVKSYLTGDSPWAAISAAMDNGVSWAKVVEGVVLAHLLTSGETPGLRSARDFLWFYYDKTGREMGNIIHADGAYLEIDLITARGPEEKSPKKISQVPACIRLTPDEYRRTRSRLTIPLSVFLALISPSTPTL